MKFLRLFSFFEVVKVGDVSAVFENSEGIKVSEAEDFKVIPDIREVTKGNEFKEIREVIVFHEALVSEVFEVGDISDKFDIFEFTEVSRISEVSEASESQEVGENCEHKEVTQVNGVNDINENCEVIGFIRAVKYSEVPGS